MNADFIKSMLANMDEKQLQTLIMSDPKQLVKMAQQFAPRALMLMDDFLAKDGMKMIKQALLEGHEDATSFISTDLPMMAMMFKTIEKEHIEQLLAVVKAQYAAEGSAEQVKGQRCAGVNHHGKPGVQLHDPHPPPGVFIPLRRIVPASRVSCITLFKAPIWIINQFTCPHADDPEGPESRGELVGELKTQSMSDL